MVPQQNLVHILILAALIDDGDLFNFRVHAGTPETPVIGRKAICPSLVIPETP